MKKNIIILASVLVAATLVMWRGGGEAPKREPLAVAVRTTFVMPDTIASKLSALGTTESYMDVDVTTKKTGKVIAIHFKANQSVAKDDLLVELESAAEQAALQEARVTLAENQRVQTHYEKLFKTRAVSQTLLEEQRAKVATSEARLSAAEAALAEMTIKAPFAGDLGFVEVSPGALIEPGDRITTLDAIDTLKLEFTAPEHWIGNIKVGDTLSAVSVAYPDKVFKARVYAVANRVDPVTRAIALKARLDNKERLLKPGMSLEVTLGGASREALVIDEEGLVQEGNRRYVYLVGADKKIELREVETGSRRDGKIEILKGLEVGEQIVREGVQSLRPSTQVAILPDGG